MPGAAPPVRANNCGFFGSSMNLILCSKCYRDYHLKEEQASSAKMAVEKSLAPSSPSSSSDSLSTTAAVAVMGLAGEVSSPVAPTSLALVVASQPSRCTTCRKRVGMAGFICRCGSTTTGPTGTWRSTPATLTSRPPTERPSPEPTLSSRPTSWTTRSRSLFIHIRM